MPGIIPIEPSSEKIYDFFYTLVTDVNGNLGVSFCEHNEVLKYFITLKPKEFYNYYIDFKADYMNNEQQEQEQEQHIHWFPNDEKECLECIDEIYKDLNVRNNFLRNGKIVNDERPNTFRLVTRLWLLIWH